MYDLMSPEERQQFDAEQSKLVAQYNDPARRKAMFAEIEQVVNDVNKREPFRFMDPPGKVRGFWTRNEDDEFGIVEDQDDFYDDEITSAAHAEVELHREVREYARIAAWDMPLLSSKRDIISLCKPTG